MATRGSPQRMAADVHQVVMASVGTHSEKPDEVHTRIERLFNGPYLELFAQEHRIAMVSVAQLVDHRNNMEPVASGRRPLFL